MTVNILTAQHVQQIGRNLSLDGSFLKTKEERADVWKISSFPFSLLLKNEEKSIRVIAHFPETEEFRERMVDVAEVHVNQDTVEFIAISDLSSNFSILDTEDIVNAIYSAFFAKSAT